MYHHLRSPLVALACTAALSLSPIGMGKVIAAETQKDSSVAIHGGGGGGGHYGGGSHYEGGYHGDSEFRGGEGHYNNHENYNHPYNNYDHHYNDNWNHNNWNNDWGGEVYVAPDVVPNGGYYVAPDGGTPVYNSNGDMDTLYDYNNYTNPTKAPSGDN